MQNAIRRSNATVAVPAERNAFEQLAAAVTPPPLEGDLLKFLKGDFVGPNEELIETGTKLIAHIPNLRVGWQKWEEGKPVQHEIGYGRDGYRPPRRSELGDNDPSAWDLDEQGRPRDPWQSTVRLPLTQCVTNRQFSFATSSKGGIGAVAKLAGTYGNRIHEVPDELPIVALGVDSYRHRNRAFGKIVIPEFKVVGWTEASAAPQNSDDPNANGRSMAPAADTPF